MSGRDAGAADRAASALIRIGRAWRALSPSQHGAAVACLALLVTLFLPWFRTTERGTRASSHPQSQSFTAWDSFSFVEALVLVVAAAILVLLFRRGEGRPARLPGGEGPVIAFAGFCTCVLIVWRMFDRDGTTTQGQIVISSGISWGIFGALFASAGLAYAGTRIRASGRAAPAAPVDDGIVFDGRWSEPVRASRPRRPATAAPAGSGPAPGETSRAVSSEAVTSATETPASEVSEASTVAGHRPLRHRRRSNWRPAERPEWTESDSPRRVEPTPAESASPPRTEPTPAESASPPRTEPAPAESASPPRTEPTPAESASPPRREPERPVGWLTAPPSEPDASPASPPATSSPPPSRPPTPPRPHDEGTAGGGSDQLTIRFDED